MSVSIRMCLASGYLFVFSVRILVSLVLPTCR